MTKKSHRELKTVTKKFLVRKLPPRLAGMVEYGFSLEDGPFELTGTSPWNTLYNCGVPQFVTKQQENYKVRLDYPMT